MISEQDRAYYERRYAEEMARGAAAEKPEVAQAHRALAARYQARLAGGITQQPATVSEERRLFIDG